MRLPARLAGCLLGRPAVAVADAQPGLRRPATGGRGLSGRAAQHWSRHAPPVGAEAGLQRLARDFWAWRAAGQPVSSDDIPRALRPPGWTPDWSAAAVAARRRELARFESRWRALAGRGRPVPEQVDHRLLGSALARVRWELDGVRLWRRDPGFYLAQTLGALVDALLPPPPFTPPRGRQVVERLGAFPRPPAHGPANPPQGAAAL